MYIPAAFRQSDPTVLFGFIERYSFATLVSGHEGDLIASHLPLLLEREPGPHGRLVGHMARANPQWRDANGQEVLAIFAGRHAYISPTWYEADNVVPTWNYIAVHAYGTFHLIDDANKVLDIVRRYVEFYERSQPIPWQLPHGNEYFKRLVQQIVGFTMKLSRLEGKWKLSQNRPADQQAKVAQALARQSNPDAQAIASWMAPPGPAIDPQPYMTAPSINRLPLPP